MKIGLLIVIPARSGSKGIADKNIKLLGGRPLLEWTVDSIRQAKIDNSLVILSTDSEKYAEIARRIGLTAPFLRPSQYANDSASAIQVAEHALSWFEFEYGYLPEQLMWLQPTSPFRSCASITQAVEMMENRQADSVIGSREIYRNLTSLFDTENGFLKPLNSNHKMHNNRQDIKPLLTPNGAMYLCKTSVLRDKKSFYGERTLPLIMDSIKGLDIDTPSDWAIAEAFIQHGLIATLESERYYG